MPSSPDVSLVVLDFDGTLTDADAHAPAFFAASERALARRLGWTDAEARRAWASALDAVMRLPDDAAWIVDGRGVCPARVDPYVIANGATRLLLAGQDPDVDPEALDAAVVEVHREAYDASPPSLRGDARRVIDDLAASGRHVRVVSNSRTEAVESRLDALGLTSRLPNLVRGHAGKFMVCDAGTPDARFAALPETVAGGIGARPLYLRRGRYFDVLRSIWAETESDPATTLVIGDVFELDLAMPAALGARVHLVQRAGTMRHEERLARAAERGGVSATLSEGLARLEG